jgi:hypothetical protein
LIDGPKTEVTETSDLEDVSNHIMAVGGTSVNVLVCTINANNRLKRYPIITMLDIGKIQLV